MIDHVFPPWLFGTNARADLTLILAFLGVTLTVCTPVGIWLIRRWTTRLTVLFTEPRLPNWMPRGGLRCGGRSLTVAGIGAHPLRLVVNARKKELLHQLNVACLERNWGTYTRAPVNVVRLSDIEEEMDPMDRHNNDDGSVTARYPAIAKGTRPFGLRVVLEAKQPWCGWLSVRDEVTNRTGRVRLCVVPGDPPPSFPRLGQ